MNRATLACALLRAGNAAPATVAGDAWSRLPADKGRLLLSNEVLHCVERLTRLRGRRSGAGALCYHRFSFPETDIHKSGNVRGTKG